MPRSDVPRDVDVPAIGDPEAPRPEAPSAHVALLTATALGFAYAPAPDEQAQARRLATLAEPHVGVLARAQESVLALEIGSLDARERAAAILRRARDVVGACGAHPVDVPAVAAHAAPTREHHAGTAA